jgi:hypothetical protein
MNTNRSFLLPLATAAAMLILPAVISAQTPPAQQKPAAAAPAQAKPQQVQQPTATPAPAKPQPAAAKPAAKPDTPAPAAAIANAKPMLLGQYDNWGAYWAAPGGHKVCFAVARPHGGQSNAATRPRYLFVTSRPMDKVKDEVSIIVGAPFKSNSDATVAVGAVNFAMVTQADGAWIKNTPDETRLIEAMRKGADLVLKGTTERGAQSADTFSLKGLAQALDRVARECK